jgi:hypothetical protein
MPKELNFPGYKTQLTPFISRVDRPSRSEAAEVDGKFLEELFAVHSQLETQQRLVLTISTKPMDQTEEGELDGYAGVVADAPFNFRRNIKEFIEKGGLVIEGYGKGEDLPDAIEISIPPDAIPDTGDKMAINSSPSRTALLTGQVRRFLDIESILDKYLSIKPTGHFLDSRLILHPSLIRNIEIKTTADEYKLSPICTFKSVAL